MCHYHHQTIWAVVPNNSTQNQSGNSKMNSKECKRGCHTLWRWLKHMLHSSAKARLYVHYWSSFYNNIKTKNKKSMFSLIIKIKRHATILFTQTAETVCWIRLHCRASTNMFKRTLRMVFFPLHSPLLRESWLVFIFTLRWIICLNLARSLAWADEWHFKKISKGKNKTKQNKTKQKKQNKKKF